MRDLLDRVTGDATPDCRCDTAFRDGGLAVEADGCPGDGDLAAAPACRAAVVAALESRDAERVTTRTGGRERAYEDDAAALLVAAGRFAARVADRDAALARRARRDPLGAAAEATGRAGVASRLAAETGLSAVAARADGYGDALRPSVGPTVARSRVTALPPPDAVLEERYDLPTGAVVRRYRRPGRELRTYHLTPVEATLDAGELATLAAAHERLAEGTGGPRAPIRAVREAASRGDPVGTLADVLRKHTRGLGVLEDLFADAAVSDVFATAPVSDGPLRVTADDEAARTNVRLTPGGAAALASRLRLSSGRAFSRASPTLDAVAEAGGRRVRVAAVTDPVSDGPGFAFRAHGTEAWTLPALVDNGTLPAGLAGLLSVAVERAAAVLVAGPRGAGKTTLLGALLWELPAGTRTVVVEDTPELPVAALRREGRDVQALRTGTAVGPGGDGPELSPAAALRTALRLGEGALVVGEVRGEEAGVLFEAMRVGAAGGAVLGTVHGDGAGAVRERVVSDLGVPASSFAATDLVVTTGVRPADGGRRRRVRAVEEVLAGDGVRFAPLFDRGEDAGATGRVERGDSRLVASLAAPGETYADVRAALDDRAGFLAGLADRGLTGPGAVVAAHAERRSGEHPC